MLWPDLEMVCLTGWMEPSWLMAWRPDCWNRLESDTRIGHEIACRTYRSLLMVSRSCLSFPLLRLVFVWQLRPGNHHHEAHHSLKRVRRQHRKIRTFRRHSLEEWQAASYSCFARAENGGDDGGRRECWASQVPSVQPAVFSSIHGARALEKSCLACGSIQRWLWLVREERDRKRPATRMPSLLESSLPSSGWP